MIRDTGYEPVNGRIINKRLFQALQQRRFESDYRVYETQPPCIVDKYVVAILSDIGDENASVAESVSPFRRKAEPTPEPFCDLRVIRTGFRTDSNLPEYESHLTATFGYAEEFKPAIWKHDVVYDMLEQRELCRMLLEMQFCEWVLDFVIDLLPLDHPNFAFARTNGVARSGDFRRIDEMTGLFGCDNQRMALSAYRI